MNDQPDIAAAVSDLANALQAAAPLAGQLRRTIADQTHDTLTLIASLESALAAATQAVRQLRPSDRSGAP